MFRCSTKEGCRTELPGTQGQSSQSYPVPGPQPFTGRLHGQGALESFEALPCLVCITLLLISRPIPESVRCLYTQAQLPILNHLSPRAWRAGRTLPYLGMPGVLLPPVQCGQVGTQPCAQMVEEDHIEWDSHQGVEDTEDLPCLRAGGQVPITCRARECADSGKREPTPGSHPQSPALAEACLHHRCGKRRVPCSYGHSPCCLKEQPLFSESSSPTTLLL